MNIINKMEGDIALAKWIDQKLDGKRLDQNESNRLCEIQIALNNGTATSDQIDYIQKTYFGQ